MSKKRKREAHIIFKRERAKERFDIFAQPLPKKPILIDMALGTREKAYAREKLLQKWGYEVAVIYRETSPEDIYGDSEFSIDDLKFR